MNSISKELIKNLNDRLLAQSVIVETLIDIILDNELITEKELQNLITENHNSQLDYIEKLKEKESNKISINFNNKESTEDSTEFLNGLYFGPIGEA